MTKGSRVYIGKKMPTLYQKVGTGCQVISGFHRKQGTIVTHSQETGRRRARKIARDKVEFDIQKPLATRLTTRSRLYLVRSYIGGHFVEHAIDELETISAAE